MARAGRTSPRGRNVQESNSNPQPPASRSRKRTVKEDSEGNQDDQEGEGEDQGREQAQPRQLKQSRYSEDGSGAAAVGAGAEAVVVVVVGRAREHGDAAGSHNVSSQGGEGDEEDDGDQEETFSFSEEQTSARSKMVKSAKMPSREVQIEVRGLLPYSARVHRDQVIKNVLALLEVNVQAKVTSRKDAKKANELSDTEQIGLIKKMMRYLLMKGLNHEPVTKKEMVDHVLGEKYRKTGVLKFILTKADEKLDAGMGFKVKTPLPGTEWFVKDTYYVVNVLNNEDHCKEILKGKDQAARGLLVLFLTMIVCSSDKSVGEDQLFKKLHDHVDKRVPEKAWLRDNPKSKVKVHVDGLGDVHEHLATFVRQHYLAKKMVVKPTADGGTDTVPFYSMGARSVLEVGNRQILELMAKVMGTTVDPSDMLDVEEQESQGLTQMATQDNL